MAMNYRSMLKAMVDNDRLYEAILRLNFHELETQKRYWRESGVQPKAPTVIQLAEQEMCSELIQEMK